MKKPAQLSVSALVAPVALAALVLLTLSSCASLKPITEIEGIVDVDFALHLGTASSGPEIAPDRLEAGKTYYVSVRYLQEKKDKRTWKNLYDYKGITLSVSDTAYRIEKYTITAPNDPFYIFNAKSAEITVSMPSPPGKTITKSTSLTLSGEPPSFQGKNGSPGEDGSPMSKNGKNGSPGADAAQFDLEAARYNTKGTKWESEGPLVILYSPQTFAVTLISPRTGRIVVNASGGSGGAGGKGADMRLAEKSPENFVQGGSGGDGGAGGRGSYAKLIVANESSVEAALVILVEGGKGGAGGKGGTGEKRKIENDILNFIAAFVTDGPSGSPGATGPAGRVAIEKKPLSEMFLRVSSPFFERERLMP